MSNILITLCKQTKSGTITVDTMYVESDGCSKNIWQREKNKYSGYKIIRYYLINFSELQQKYHIANCDIKDSDLTPMFFLLTHLLMFRLGIINAHSTSQTSFLNALKQNIKHIRETRPTNYYFFITELLQRFPKSFYLINPTWPKT